MGFNGTLVALCFVFVCFKIGFCLVPQESVPKEYSTNSTLELLHVVFRHGPRTPVNTYPNDPYVNETFYPYGWGHLTNTAKQELYALGLWLRKRYTGLLGSYFQNDIVHAQSTASPRTQMSLATVLASLFSPKNTPMEWNTHLDWQPVPIYSDSLETDILLRMTAKCPRYDEALQEVFNLPEVRAELTAHSALFNELSTITGMNVSNANDVNSIYITLLAEQGYGLPLPHWSHEYFPEKMKFMAEQNYIYNAYTTEMRKIKGGPFLQKMFNEMQQKANNLLKPVDKKLFIYCAHDWSITNILSAFNVWKRQMPHFSALVVFELHKNLDSEKHFVQIYFKNDPNQEPKRLIVPGCEFECPLEKLIELSDPVLPTESYEKMCQTIENKK